MARAWVGRESGVITKTEYRRTDYPALVSLLRPGDLLEFQREGYQHWAVYVGEHALEISPGQFPVLPCIVHRANPADSPSLLVILVNAF